MTYASELIADSVLEYCALDEPSGTTAADSSGNTRPMTLNGSVSVNATKVMPAGTSAYDFPGVVSAYLTAASAAWMQVPSFTITAWIQMDSTSSYRCIWSRDVSGVGTRGPSFYVTSGKLNLFAGSDNLGTATLSTGTNYFVAVTYDSATSTLVYYINGAVDKTINAVSIPNTGAYDIVIGASRAASPSLNFPFDGRIDDVAYFGSALSAARIAAHYTAATATGASGSGSLSFSGSGAAGVRAAGTGAVSVAGTGTAGATASGSGALSFSGTGVIDFQPASGSGAISVSGAGAAGVGVAGAGSVTVDGTGAATGATSATGTGSVTLTGFGVATLAAAASGSMTLGGLASAFALFVTDLSNAMNGRRRRGRGTATVTRAAAPPPPGRTFAKRYDKAIAYPMPDMIDGRAE